MLSPTNLLVIVTNQFHQALVLQRPICKVPNGHPQQILVNETVENRESFSFGQFFWQKFSSEQRKNKNLGHQLFLVGHQGMPKNLEI